MSIGWWINSNTGRISHGNHSTGSPPWIGPYASRAAAQMALGGNTGNGGGGSGSGGFGGGTGGVGGGVLGGISASAIAGDALKYIGHPYSYGGAPGTDGSSGWDCSSFINWVLGHDFNMKLPGSLKPGYNGTSHGPAVINYVSWRGAKTVASPEAGDLCIWVGIGVNGHIGIAVSPNQMVSALNPGLGTAKTVIHGSGPGGSPLIFRQIVGAGSFGGALGSGCLPGAGLLARLI